ncbi:unnamed protein product, partial [Urochloa humidicola]
STTTKFTVSASPLPCPCLPTPSPPPAPSPPQPVGPTSCAPPPTNPPCRAPWRADRRLRRRRSHARACSIRRAPGRPPPPRRTPPAPPREEKSIPSPARLIHCRCWEPEAASAPVLRPCIRLTWVAAACNRPRVLQPRGRRLPGSRTSVGGKSWQPEEGGRACAREGHSTPPRAGDGDEQAGEATEAPAPLLAGEAADADADLRHLPRLRDHKPWTTAPA